MGHGAGVLQSSRAWPVIASATICLIVGCETSCEMSIVTSDCASYPNGSEPEVSVTSTVGVATSSSAHTVGVRA